MKKVISVKLKSEKKELFFIGVDFVKMLQLVHNHNNPTNLKIALMIDDILKDMIEFRANKDPEQRAIVMQKLEEVLRLLYKSS